MSRIESRLTEIDWLYDLQQQDIWINRLHPLAKVLTLFLYVGVVFTINKYDLPRMVLMSIYLIIGYTVAELELREALWRVKVILPLVIMVGLFNPFFDRTPMVLFGNIMVGGGWLSMMTMMLKGIYSVLAAYMLIATTSIEEICHAFRMLHVPRVLVTVILLTYRYLLILGKEADRIMTAYELRAPSQKGIHYKVWGPLLGQWMLRSFDRAERVYESMVLRGFRGEFPEYREYHTGSAGRLYILGWAVLLLVLRLLPLGGL